MKLFLRNWLYSESRIRFERLKIKNAIKSSKKKVEIALVTENILASRFLQIYCRTFIHARTSQDTEVKLDRVL